MRKSPWVKECQQCLSPIAIPWNATYNVCDWCRGALTFNFDCPWMEPLPIVGDFL